MTASIDLPSVQVTNTLVNRSDTMEFDVTVSAGAAIPRAGNEVVFLNGAAREFAGILATTEEELINPGAFRYRCTAKDYSQLFDKLVVTNQYPASGAAQAADVTVKAIVASYCPGFTANNVEPAPLLAAQQFDDQYPSDCIKFLADALEWFWYIDYTKDVHFAPLEAFISPLPGNLLDADNDTASYHDLVLREDATQIKNRIYLKNLKVKNQNSIPFQWQGNGTQQWFPLGYEAYDLASVSLSVNGTPYPIRKEFGQGAPGDGQADQAGYVCFDNMGVRITPTPPSGATIAGTIVPVYGPMKTMVDDPEAQVAMAAREGGDGIHEYVVNDPSLSGPTTDTAMDRGQLLLYKYAYPKVSGTMGSYLQGWRAGQYFYLKATSRMAGMFATPQRMYITQVVKRVVSHPAGGAPLLHYDLTISDNPYTF